MNKTYYRNLFQRADKEKQKVRHRYDEAIAYTFPSNDRYFDFGIDGVFGKNLTGTIFDDITIEVSETLANQMELSLTKSGIHWASFSVDDPINNKEAAQIAHEKTKEVFDKIIPSNFQKNISSVYKDLIIGTSAIKIFVIGNGKTKKLSFKHLDLNNLYILEDGLGNVDTCFYEINDFTIEKIYSMLGLELELDDEMRTKYYDDQGLPNLIDIVECAIPLDNGKWKFLIAEKGFDTIFFEKELAYNPYVVIRFNKKNDGSPWGVGKAVERLALIKSIQEYSKLKLRSVYSDVKPAYVLKTNAIDPPQLNLTPGYVNHVNQQFEIEPLFTRIPLQELESIIQEMKEQLKQAFLIDAILEAQARNTYKTATEIQTANQKFLDKFATYASAISEELSKEIFVRSYKLLVSEKIIKPLPKEIEEKISYSNPIIKNEKSKNVEKIIQMAQAVIGLIGQEAFAKEIKAENVIPFFLDSMGVPGDIFISEEDKKQMAQQEAQQQQMQQLQEMMGGQAGGQGQINSQNLGTSALGGGQGGYDRPY